MSDPNEGYAALGHKILGEELGIPESKLSFLQESAEKSSVTSGTIDLVAACQMLHWTDPDAAVDEFHRQLKPGGTLAITAYTRPRILGNPAAQRAWRGIFAAHAKGIGARGDLYLRALRNGNSAFESVGFPEGKWREVRRVYINSGGTLEAFRIDERVGESKVGPGEERIWKDGDQDWMDLKRIDWLRGYFSTWIPLVSEEETRHLWEDLEASLDGQEVAMETPVVMILATKV